MLTALCVGAASGWLAQAQGALGERLQRGSGREVRSQVQPLQHHQLVVDLQGECAVVGVADMYGRVGGWERLAGPDSKCREYA